MPLKIEGRKYVLPIGILHLYPIAKLAQALTNAGIPRTTQSIRNWIEDGTLPKPMFHCGKIKPKGLYSKAQIEAIVQAAKEANICQGAGASLSRFKQLVFEKLTYVNLQVIQMAERNKKREEARRNAKTNVEETQQQT